MTVARLAVYALVGAVFAAAVGAIAVLRWQMATDIREIEREIVAISPDRAAAYATTARVIGVRYAPAEAGLFWSRGARWEADVDLDGRAFTVPVTDGVASRMQAGEAIPVVAYPCGDRSRGVCGVGLADPAGNSGMDSILPQQGVR